MTKKFLFSTVFLLGSLSLFSQDIAENAIGIRLGDNDGAGAEVNYQRAIGDNNRLEFGLSAHSRKNFSSVKLTGIYQWVWNIDGGLNWYTGPGVGVGQTYFDKSSDFRDRNTDTFVFATGDIGLEYNFDFPLLVSIDFRPELGFGEYRKDVLFDIGIAARYQF